jgi:hypothetical protein
VLFFALRSFRPEISINYRIFEHLYPRILRRNKFHSSKQLLSGEFFHKASLISNLSIKCRIFGHPYSHNLRRRKIVPPRQGLYVLFLTWNCEFCNTQTVSIRKNVLRIFVFFRVQRSIPKLYERIGCKKKKAKTTAPLCTSHISGHSLEKGERFLFTGGYFPSFL